MINAVIKWSINNRVLVLLACVLLVGAGLYSVKKTPVDAIPDLSDVQVIIKTSYAGQAPQVVEEQVTYPLTTAMLSVPGHIRYVVFHFLVIPTFMSFLMMTRICTGRARGYLNIYLK